MIDKEKQIEEMAIIIAKQNCKPCGCENCDYAYEYGTKEESCEDYVSYRRMAEAFYNVGYRKQVGFGWISVDERLPEMHEDVLCLCGRFVEIDFMCSDGTWCGVHNNPITHWMPLPEPPKMKGSAE